MKYSLIRYIYTLFLFLSLPLIVFRLWWRGRANKGYRRRLVESFGIFKAPKENNGLWLHAVSLGESVAATPFIQAFQKKFPHLPITISTTTVTGAARIKSTFGDSVFHVYFPYDLPFCITTFLKKIRPKLFIITETERWPNCLHYCRQQKIPVVIMNARVSPRSFNRYKRLGFFMRDMLSALTVVAAQSKEDGERFLELGLEPDRLIIAGNTKFDVPEKAGIHEKAYALRNSWGMERPAFAAASTHPGEELQVLEAFKKIQKEFSNALLMIIPRHPERFGTVATLIESQGFKMVARSQQHERIPQKVEVFLGDTMGELELFYAASDVAFVGGSLVPVGCHNLLEAAALSIPILTGPHVFNSVDMNKLLIEAGGAVRVTDSESIAKAVIHWFSNPADRLKAGEAAKAAFKGQQGAVQKIMEALPLNVD